MVVNEATPVKTLLLIRHAHAGNGDPRIRDRDRPLSPRGQIEAHAVGQRLASQRFSPDMMITSPALRTCETARIIGRALSYTLEDIVPIEKLYECNVEIVDEVVRALNDRLDRVILVGHNPAISEFAYRLSERVEFMAPAAVARFEFRIAQWPEIDGAVPAMATLETPSAG